MAKFPCVNRPQNKRNSSWLLTSSLFVEKQTAARPTLDNSNTSRLLAHANAWLSTRHFCSDPQRRISRLLSITLRAARPCCWRHLPRRCHRHPLYSTRSLPPPMILIRYYAPGFRPAALRQLQLQPDLAGLGLSATIKTYTFVLQRRRWHDGEPVMRQRRLFTIRLIQDPAVTALCS